MSKLCRICGGRMPQWGCDRTGAPVCYDCERDPQRHRYRVHMCTRGGMFAQYDGHVDVWAVDDDAAIDEAFRELRRTAFPDYSRDMWRVESVERAAVD